MDTADTPASCDTFVPVLLKQEVDRLLAQRLPRDLEVERQKPQTASRLILAMLLAVLNAATMEGAFHFS